MFSRLSTLIFILFASVSFAQNENKNLDSLLLEYNFLKLQEALQNSDTSEASSYQGIISAIKEIPNLNNKDLLITQAKRYKNYYVEAYTGIFASKAFEKFESSENQGKHDEAITFFYIARFFKNNFIPQMKSALDRDFKVAQEYYKQREFKRSLELWENIERKTYGNPFFAPSFTDSVKSFSLKAKEKFMTDEKEKKDWSFDEKNDYSYNFTLGGGLLYYPSLTQYNLIRQIPAKIKGEVGFRYSFTAGYKLLDYLMLCFSYSAGSVKYKELELPQTIGKASIEVKNSDILLSAKYYLKTPAGICPYIGLGYGYSSFSRSSFSSKTMLQFYLLNGDKYHEIVELSMPENSFSTTMMNAIFGLDYVHSAQSWIMYNLGFSFDKSLQSDYFLKGYKLAIGFNVGILF
ncbi:MAG: hypothetical protein ACM3QX_05895 [Syntrophomonadaceae bacterium]